MSETPEGLPRFPKRSGRRKSAAQAGGSLLNAGGGMRVATYTRISTDEVNQPYSLEAQADHLNKYLSMRPEWSLVGQYSDQMTGSVMERPGLKKLLADVRAGKLDVILVYRVDRFSRKLHHIQDLLQVLEQEKVAFVSATEAFDTSNSMGRMVLNILGVFAEFERSSLIDRIRAGNAAKASRGEWVGGKPPYGYQVAEGKTLRIIESEAAVVRDIFRMAIDENMGGLNIAMALTQAGIRSRGSEWTSKKVIAILRRPTYAGWIVHHDETYAGLHPAIIEPDTFEKVQALLDERGTPWDRRSASLEYKLSGLLKCTNCGSSMIAERTNSGSGNSYRYYICRRRKIVARTACHSPRINADVLEEAVLGSLVSVYRDYGLFTQAAERAIAAREESLPHTIEQLKAVDGEIAKVSASLNRYLAAFEAGTMDAAACGPRVSDLQHQLGTLTMRRNELQLVIDAPAPKLPSAKDTKVMAAALERELKERSGPALKALLATLIERIHVSPDRVITPYLRVPDIGPVEVDPVRALADSVEDPAVTEHVGIAVSVSSERLWLAGRTRDKVLEILSELEEAGEGPEFATSRLIDVTLQRWPELKRDSVWRIINKDLCRSRGGRPISLVKVRPAVVRRATADEAAASVSGP
jgi:site-specific DNA recombinase